MKLERSLDDWYTSWIEYQAHQESPVIYDKWVALSLIGSALERKVFLQWDKRIYPNLYIVLVGHAGCRKGTAMYPGKPLLNEIGAKVSADATTRERLIQILRESSDTFEALDNQIHSYAALTIYSEELTVFLGYNNQQLMQDLADWYDCKDHWSYETKHQDKDIIDGLWVNLIGATTPELLQDTLPRESFAGGLNSRIVYIYADISERRLSLFPHLYYESQEAKELYQILTTDLQIIKMTAGKYEPDESYLERWKSWYPRSTDTPLKNNLKMSGYINRRPTHIHKLAMLFNASRDGGLLLTSTDFDRALELLTETEKRMTKTFEGIGRSRTSITMHQITEYIKTKGKVEYAELQRVFGYDADEREMSIIIATLERGRIVNFNREEIEGFKNFYVEYIGDKL